MYKRQYQYDDSTGKGLVISQSVKGGEKVKPDTSIDLVVSNGPKPEEKISVKSFVGQSESALIQWANSNGLEISCVGEEYSDSYELGDIISQSPSSGKVSKGTTIRYKVSAGSRSSGDDEETSDSEDEE